MRLVTFNLHHGRSPHDGRVDCERVTTTVTTLDPDILALQEVDHHQRRSGHHDLTTIAAHALHAPTHHFAATIIGTPGDHFRPSRHDDDGHHQPRYGISLISRYPARDWRTTRLTPAPLRAPAYQPDHGPFLLRDEPRVLLTATLDTPIGPVTVATTHLSFVPGWNIHQLRQVIRALRALPAPRLLLGDLNLPTGLTTLVTGWRPLARHHPTYPADRPRLQLDHILADPRGAHPLPAVATAHAPHTPISDHRPLVVDLHPRPR